MSRQELLRKERASGELDCKRIYAQAAQTLDDDVVLKSEPQTSTRDTLQPLLRSSSNKVESVLSTDVTFT